MNIHHWVDIPSIGLNKTLDKTQNADTLFRCHFFLALSLSLSLSFFWLLLKFYALHIVKFFSPSHERISSLFCLKFDYKTFTFWFTGQHKPCRITWMKLKFNQRKYINSWNVEISPFHYVEINPNPEREGGGGKKNRKKITRRMLSFLLNHFQWK